MRSFPDAFCDLRYGAETWSGVWVVVSASGGAMTAFGLDVEDTPQGTIAARVIEVLVQRSWHTDQPNLAREECFPNWRSA